jgi:hypothetical protein
MISTTRKKTSLVMDEDSTASWIKALSFWLHWVSAKMRGRVIFPPE